jgi:hypothetical protein
MNKKEKGIMKKLVIAALCIITLQANAQKLIPFQYQNQQQWNYQQKWGLMTADRKIVLPPTYYSIDPKVVEDAAYLFVGNGIVETKTGKMVWDSLECVNVDKIVGNIASIRMPLRGPYNYQPYSFKNIKTKKLIAQEGRWAPIDGFVVTEGGGEEGVVDENGKEIIKQIRYQYINRNAKECFIATNGYDGYKYIYDLKGNKLNTKSYDEIEVGTGKKQLLVGYNLVDKTKNIYELIFINSVGKEVGEHLFYIKQYEQLNSFDFNPYNGIAIKRKEATLFYKKECDEASKINNQIVVTQDGKIILNDKSLVDTKESTNNLLVTKSEDLKTTTLYNYSGKVAFTTNAFTNIEIKDDNLFFATDTADKRKYFINNKGEKLVNGAVFHYTNLIRSNAGNGFLVYKKEYNKLFFNTYNAKTGVSKFGEQFEMESGITVNDISAGGGKYYLVNVADNNKKQYATYIYDITGKLIQKSEDGLWMYNDGFFIKYTFNKKGDKMYIGYYDNDLKPYSIITN